MGVTAVVAPQDPEMAANIRKLAALDVLHPGPKHPELDAVLDLAGNGAGVTANAFALVDDERALGHRP